MAKNKDIASVDYRVGLHQRLQDVEYRAAYINAVIEEGDESALLIALRDVVEATGGVEQAGLKANLHPKATYRILSPKGNPRFSSIGNLLRAVGLRLKVETEHARPSKKRTRKTDRAA